MKYRLDPTTAYQQGMGIGLNVAQNLNPSAGLGFLLGNIAGNRLNNYMNEQRAMKTYQLQDDFNQRWRNYRAPNPALQSVPVNPTAQNLEQYGKSLMPKFAVQQTPNQYDFSKFHLPSLSWQPPVNNNLLRW